MASQQKIGRSSKRSPSHARYNASKAWEINKEAKKQRHAKAKAKKAARYAAGKIVVRGTTRRLKREVKQWNVL